MAAVAGQQPGGRNEHFRYNFWEESAVAGTIRGLFVTAGLVLGVDVVDVDIKEGKTSKGGHTWLTTLRVLFTVTDIKTGTTTSGHGVGQGDDPGDKGSNKALTGALKFWLLKSFLMGGEDAEADRSTDQRHSDDDEQPRRRRRRESGRADSVTVEDSAIEGIERGGRSTGATEIQVQRVRSLARELGLGISGISGIIEQVLGTAPSLPSEADEQAPALATFLAGLSAEDIGNVITYMGMMDKLKNDREDDDSDRAAP